MNELTFEEQKEMIRSHLASLASLCSSSAQNIGAAKDFDEMNALAHEIYDHIVSTQQGFCTSMLKFVSRKQKESAQS